MTSQHYERLYPCLKAHSALAVNNGDERCQVLLCKYRATDASIFPAGPALQGEYYRLTVENFPWSVTLQNSRLDPKYSADKYRNLIYIIQVVLQIHFN